MCRDRKGWTVCSRHDVAIGAMKDIRRNLTRPDLRPSIGREEVVEVAV